MQHPGMNAEIARLSHAHAVREARRSHRLDGDEPVTETVAPSTVARLAGRLMPELHVTLPWPVAARRAPVRH